MQRLNALAVVSDTLGERAIERAVKEEFPVFGVEAYDVRRQHIGGEIRREPQNVLVALTRGAGLAICHDVHTGIPSCRCAAPMQGDAPGIRSIGSSASTFHAPLEIHWM